MGPGMLGTMTMGLTSDAFKPFCDIAGAIVEMSGMPEDVRAMTNCSNTAGNATAAIKDGFAIFPAVLVSLALFDAFCTRAHVEQADVGVYWFIVRNNED